jgi:VCBS repeat-containing protein
VAADDAYTTPLDTPLVVEEPGVLANDTDAENDHTIAQLVTQPTNGTVELAPDGSFTYTATPGFTGEATFTYRAADETGVSEPATVTITVEQGTTAVTVQTFSTGSAPALPWSGMILLALTGSVLAARAWRVRR